MKKEKIGVVFPGDKFFASKRRNFISLTYDDVLIEPGHSDVNPGDANLQSLFSRNVPVLLPVSSSPMTTVTQGSMAIAMARNGGIGIIDPSLTKEQQKDEITLVKHNLNWRITDPITIRDNLSMKKLLDMVEKRKFKFQTFPVIGADGKFVGLITGNHFLFHRNSPRKLVGTIMNKNVVMAKPRTTIKQARRIMTMNNVKVLPLVNNDGQLDSMYIWDDVERYFDESGQKHRFNVDKNGNLRLGVAIGLLEDGFESLDYFFRFRKRPDVVVIDTSHGHKTIMLDTVREIKRQWPDIDVVAGNVATAEAARYLAKAGVDGIRVGFGPGSICTTRVITGTGVPQITAINECSKAVRGSGIPIIADGGIKYPGDIGKAIAAGADVVMLGSMLAGCDEAPGEEKIVKGVRYKIYMGMGSEKSLQTLRAARNRYSQKKNRPIVPEGVEGRVLCIGPVAKLMDQLEGGLRATMKNIGAATIPEIQAKANFTQVLAGGMKEAHPTIEGIEESANYKSST